jgi:GTP-binding protein YchF
MEIGIIGLPKSGKTTLFNTLTRGKAEIGTYATVVPNIGVAKVPDPRIGGLDGIFHPKRKVAAEVKYIDVAASTKGELSGAFLTHLSQTDGLLHVVRAFEDDNVPHIEGSIDAERDVKLLDLELTFSDLSIIEKRLRKIDGSFKGAKAHEREAFSKEQALLERIKTTLEGEVPIREQELTDNERKSISGYQFLSAKPLLTVFNIGEERLPESRSIEEEWRNKYRRPHVDIAVLCGKLEMELVQLDEADAREFRSTIGIAETALNRIIGLCYELLGLISFFTVVSDEVKAWTIQRNTTAEHAAGKIHTDMERGFIRAEVIAYDDLMKCGSITEGRKHGLLHTEGKSYIVRDGDVITFLFNV